MEKRWLTYANGLSLLRLLAAPPAVVCVLNERYVPAALLFVIAVVTDFADGPIARRRGEATPLGGLIDHSIDALFVASLLAALATGGLVPALLPVLVAAAFVQYVLDSKALRGRTLRTSSIGKWNGVAYFVLAGTPIIRDALQLPFPANRWVIFFGWLLVATTAVSMTDRLLALSRKRSIS